MPATRKPEATNPMSADERRSYIRRCEDMIETMRKFDATCGEDVTAYVFRKSSLNDGLRRCEAFTSDLRRTINMMIAGKRLTAKSKKTDLVG